MSEAQSRGAGGFVRATGVFLSGLRDRVRLPAARHAGVGSGSAPKEVGRNSGVGSRAAPSRSWRHRAEAGESWRVRVWCGLLAYMGQVLTQSDVSILEHLVQH